MWTTVCDCVREHALDENWAAIDCRVQDFGPSQESGIMRTLTHTHHLSPEMALFISITTTQISASLILTEGG